MVITDLPEKMPGLDACAACIAAKAVHFPHKERYSCAGEYLGRVHNDIARPMQVKSAGGKEYEYIAVDDYTRAVYTQPLRLKLDATEAFKVFKAVADNESQKRIHEIMKVNARELCMGEMKDTCEKESIKLHTSIRYSPESRSTHQRGACHAT